MLDEPIPYPANSNFLGYLADTIAYLLWNM